MKSMGMLSVIHFCVSRIAFNFGPTQKVNMKVKLQMAERKTPFIKFSEGPFQEGDPRIQSTNR